MKIQIDPANPQPPYEQIRTQICAQIDSGELRVGDRLPPIRTLASELSVAAGTVARAYRELEAEHVLQTKTRSGTTVASSAVRTETAAKQAAQTYLDTLAPLGLDPAAALTTLRSVIKERTIG